MMELNHKEGTPDRARTLEAFDAVNAVEAECMHLLTMIDDTVIGDLFKEYEKAVREVKGNSDADRSLALNLALRKSEARVRAAIRVQLRAARAR